MATPTYYTGIDLHKRIASLTTVDGSGQVAGQKKRPCRRALCQYFASFEERSDAPGACAWYAADCSVHFPLRSSPACARRQTLSLNLCPEDPAYTRGLWFDCRRASQPSGAASAGGCSRAAARRSHAAPANNAT